MTRTIFFPDRNATHKIWDRRRNYLRFCSLCNRQCIRGDRCACCKPTQMNSELIPIAA